MTTSTLLKNLTIFVTLSSLVACTNHTTTRISNPNTSPTSTLPMVASTPKLKNTAKVTKINVTAKEMVVLVPLATAPSGLVEFVVKNEGKKPHEFVIFKKNLLNKKLPLKGTSLDEDSPGLKNLGEISESKLQSGTTQTLKLKLTPGRYLLVCNLPGHFQAGMKAEFIVK